jgi:predicted phage terminase large subunit-like protein
MMSKNARGIRKRVDAATVDQLFELLSPAARRKYLDMQLTTDFGVFLMKVFETVAPGREFIGNWHIDAMTYAAELVMKGEIKQLIINVPPRHLKSIIYSVALPAFMLGRDPTKRIICVSYALDLAVKHANDFRTVLNSTWYRRIFPDTRISRNKDTQTETMTTALGYRFSTSLGGIVTGRGADVIILDDPQKPDEALSEVHRKSAINWFDATLLSRLDSKSDGVIVLVMQRLHEDDLAGYLLEKVWHHLKIPAIAEQDQWIPVGQEQVHQREADSVIDQRRESTADLEKLKIKMGSQNFSAQYQQEPIPLEGNLIKREWFKEYDVAPICADADKLVISIDTAMKGDELAVFSVATVWLARGEHSYIIDLWRERVDYPGLKHAVWRLREKYPRATLLIEDKGSGTSLIQELRLNNIGVIAVNPEGDKVTRCAAVSAQFEAGCVFFPKSAPWLDNLKAELLGFPNTKYDDQVDSVTQALNWIARQRQNEVRWVAPIVVTQPRRYFGDPPDNWWLGP